MRIDQLQLDLRPRPNWQAIDLGFTLLRESAGTVYAAWLALWVPLVTICFCISLLFPASWGQAWVWMVFVPWWLRPFCERIVIFILSRAVFGERVTWKTAVRAWPKQLGGGWFRLITWWRPIMAGRGLYQPVWQLENARGKFSRERRAVLSRNGAGASAYWFGIACAHFEAIIQFGLMALISIYLSPPDEANPFLLFTDDHFKAAHISQTISFTCTLISAGLMGPIYTACCFTLYMNRRATLEAWDIELTLKQLKAPSQKKTASSATTAILALFACTLLALHSTPVRADDQRCTPPAFREFHPETDNRTAPHNAAQAKIRQKLDSVYANPDLNDYQCIQSWQRKNTTTAPDAPKKLPTPMEFPRWIAVAVKFTLIAIAICLVAWLLYRFRDHIGLPYMVRKMPELPDAIGGLDIRPESLPNDVVSEVRRLWAAQCQREALALLYRATLSRLAHQFALALPVGATEGDCLQSAERAASKQQLSGDILDVIQRTTQLWLLLAYAHQIPDEQSVESACSAWQRHLAGGTQ